MWVKVQLDRGKEALVGSLYPPPNTSQTQMHTDFNEIGVQL